MLVLRQSILDGVLILPARLAGWLRVGAVRLAAGLHPARLKSFATHGYYSINRFGTVVATVGERAASTSSGGVAAVQVPDKSPETDEQRWLLDLAERKGLKQEE